MNALENTVKAFPKVSNPAVLHVERTFPKFCGSQQHRREQGMIYPQAKVDGLQDNLQDNGTKA